MLLEVSIRDEEPAAVRLQCLGVSTGLGPPLAPFEALNIQKSAACITYAWLCNIFVHKSDMFQQKVRWSMQIGRIREIERNSDAMISSVVGSL